MKERKKESGQVARERRAGILGKQNVSFNLADIILLG